MAALLSSLSILGYCIFLRRLLRWPIEILPFFVASAIIVLLYAFAYVNFLHIGTAFLFYLGIILLLLSALFLQYSQGILKDYFTPGIAIFIFFMIVYGLMAHTVTVTSFGDDIGRWMPHAKLLFLHQGFLQATDVVANVDYPPGGALFYYFFIHLTHFSERKLFFAQLFLILTPIIILLYSTKWQQWSNAFILFSLLLISFTYLFDVQIGPKATTMMDVPAGLFFGGILASYYLLQKEQALYLFLIVPAMAMVLFKPMLYPFVLIIGLIIAVDQWYLKKYFIIKQYAWLKNLSFILAPVLIFFTWQHYIHRLGVESTWSLAQLFSAVYHHHTVLDNNEFHHVISLYFHLSLSAFIFAFAIIFSIILICKLHAKKMDQYRFITAHSILAVGFFLYLIFLLLFYLYQMDTQISGTLNSFERFTYTYEIAWVMLLLTHIVLLVRENNISFIKQISPWLKYSIIVFLVANMVIKGFHQVGANEKSMQKKKGWWYMLNIAKEDSSKIKALTGSNAKIGIIGDEELAPQFSYQLIPITAHYFYNGFDNKQLFSEYLKQFDYLLIIGVSDSFWNQYNNYFAVTDRIPLLNLSICQKTVKTAKKCVMQTKPIFLYKIIKLANDDLSFQNMISRSS